MSGFLTRIMAASLKPLRNRRGQLAISSLFLIPSLFLFVFLIYETTKISREKIRHQFALDAAVFTEMSNYTDFLNRSAYINGAFPQRVFAESFKSVCFDLRKDTVVPEPNPNKDSCSGIQKNLYDLLYENNAFPADYEKKWNVRIDEGEDWPKINKEWPMTDEIWPLKFHGPRPGFPYDLNKEEPDMPDEPNKPLEIITADNVDKYWITWDDAQDIYRLYAQLYILLGEVEGAQYSVFCRMTGASGCKVSDARHVYYRKAYALNSGDQNYDASQEGADWFNNSSFVPKKHCVKELMIYGLKATGDPFDPYGIWKPLFPVSAPDTCGGDPTGMFMLLTVPKGQLKNLSAGYPVTQSWDQGKMLSDNYFQVSFHGGDYAPGCPDGIGPCVHATGAVHHPSGSAGEGVWPNPTPKFFTALHP